jgi:hypothetical protein
MNVEELRSSRRCDRCGLTLEYEFVKQNLVCKWCRREIHNFQLALIGAALALAALCALVLVV